MATLVIMAITPESKHEVYSELYQRWDIETIYDLTVRPP